MTSPENFDNGDTRVADNFDARIFDKYTRLLFNETGFVNSKSISWNLVAIPIIKEAEKLARDEERQRIKKEIEKIVNDLKENKIYYFNSAENSCKDCNFEKDMLCWHHLSLMNDISARIEVLGKVLALLENKK